MMVSRLLKSWAMPPVSWPRASIFWAWRMACSAVLWAVRSWMMPVKKVSPCSVNSLTDRCMGKVVPSARRPVTWRPLPMILRLPVTR